MELNILFEDTVKLMQNLTNNCIIGMKTNMFFCVIPFILIFNLQQSTPTINKNGNNEEMQRILNVIINSPQFDSINKLCDLDSCRFLYDEEFYKNMFLQLKEKNPKFSILNNPEQDNSCFWILGDFFISPYIENPEEARIQMEFVLENKEGLLIGIGMKKANNQWYINEFTIYK